MTMQTNQDFELALDFITKYGNQPLFDGKSRNGKNDFPQTIERNFTQTNDCRRSNGSSSHQCRRRDHPFLLPTFVWSLSFPYPQGGRGEEADFKHQFRKEKINILRSMDLLVIDEVKYGPRRRAGRHQRHFAALPGRQQTVRWACNCCSSRLTAAGACRQRRTSGTC